MTASHPTATTQPAYAHSPERFRLDRTSPAPAGLLPQVPQTKPARRARVALGGAGSPFSCAALFLFLLMAGTAMAVDDSGSYQSRGEWVSNLGWFIGGIGVAITAYDKLRRKPVLEVEFLRREEADKRLERLSAKIDGIRKEVQEEFRLLRIDMTQGTHNVQAKFDDVIEKIGELRGGQRHA